ncbi:MAG: anhydro-N-acetylmuramic acid kinase [Porticoccaceae bacterium]|nr:anhydro-N-acetylmuramic acid kinase [Porticoccaceae bacterium]
MSGTSIDGIDTLLAEFPDNGRPTVLGWHSHGIPDSLRQELTALSTPDGDTIDLLGQADQALGELFAEATLALLEACAIAPQQITAIGSHGQTVRHRPPGKHQAHPFTLQIGDPNIIASRTGITTVADFRRADIAAGGQGAPLAPTFHRHVFSDSEQNRVIVNIGGMANITWLPAQGEAIGFDTGPGNRLLDYWSQQHLKLPFDDKGHWASQHDSNSALLSLFKNHPFFIEPAPKSTGREAFNEQWLHQQLALHEQELRPGDVQATLLNLTVETISDSIASLPGLTHEVYICGGGAYNDELMNCLQKALTPVSVASTDILGVDPDKVEALAFAWLAQRTLAGQTGNLPAVTGAREEVVLGGIYPGKAWRN